MRSCSRSAAGRLGHGAVRLDRTGIADVGEAAVWNRPTCRRRPPARKPAHSRHRAQPKGGGSIPCLVPRAVPHTPVTRFASPVVTLIRSKLILAQQFDLPHPEHFNSWSAPRLDPAADTNPSMFEGLKHDSGALEHRDHALWNSHSKVLCPVPAEIQVSRCPGLPNRQHLALDKRKTPDPGQNIARTFGVFYDRRIGPDASFARRPLPRAAKVPALLPPPARRGAATPCRSLPSQRPGAGGPAPATLRRAPSRPPITAGSAADLSRNTNAGWRP